MAPQRAKNPGRSARYYAANPEATPATGQIHIPLPLVMYPSEMDSTPQPLFTLYDEQQIKLYYKSFHM